MGNLFVFGIGGTGSRVIKALTMLLASGVKLNAKKVIPIIIDPDARNGDKIRTVEILKRYRKIREQLDNSDNYFSTDISTLSVLSKGQVGVGDTFGFDFQTDDTFKKYINTDDLDFLGRGMVDLLFEEEILNTPLTVGFKGYPNVGSVVLNQQMKSKELIEFAQHFGHDDRIFIVSSIFGGTGAAGFPLLLKNLRNTDKTNPLAQKGTVQKAKIGAVTVKPYFSLNADADSAIDSNSFITKTITALSYYKENLQGLDAMYYVGDHTMNTYKNVEGDRSQKNAAHFVEVASAMAIVDFMNYSDEKLAARPLFHEFGLKDNPDMQFNFSSIPDDVAYVKKPLASFMVACKFFAEHFKTKDATRTRWFDSFELDDDKNKSLIQFIQDFKHFLVEGEEESFRAFVEEMHNNKVSFSPFHLEAGKELGALIKNNEIITKGLFSKKFIDFDKIDEQMNEQCHNMVQHKTPQEFLNVLNQAINEVFKDS